MTVKPSNLFQGLWHVWCPPIDRLLLIRANFYSQESPFIIWGVCSFAGEKEHCWQNGWSSQTGRLLAEKRSACCTGQQCASLFRISSTHYIDLFSELERGSGLGAHVYQYGPCKGVPYSQNRLVRHSACVLCTWKCCWTCLASYAWCTKIHKDALNCKSAVPSRHSWRSLEIGYGSWEGFWPSMWAGFLIPGIWHILSVAAYLLLYAYVGVSRSPAHSGGWPGHTQRWPKRTPNGRRDTDTCSGWGVDVVIDIKSEVINIVDLWKVHSLATSPHQDTQFVGTCHLSVLSMLPSPP